MANGRYYGDDGKQYTSSGYEIVNRKAGSTGTSSTGGRLNGGTYIVDGAPSGGGGVAPGGRPGGGADFNSQIQAALDKLNNRTDTAAQSQLNALKRAQREAAEAREAAYDQNVGQLESGTAEAQRQAYVQKMKSQQNIPQAMAAAGYSGGMTESTAGGLESSYQNALSTIQNQKVSELAKLQRDLQEGSAQDTNGYQSQIAQALSTIQQQQYDRDLTAVDLLRGLRNDQFDMEQQLAARAAEEEKARMDAQLALQRLNGRGTGGGGSGSSSPRKPVLTYAQAMEQMELGNMSDQVRAAVEYYGLNGGGTASQPRRREYVAQVAEQLGQFRNSQAAMNYLQGISGNLNEEELRYLSNMILS